MDLRHARGISKTKNWIKYVSVDEALGQADFVSVHVPLLREGESSRAHLSICSTRAPCAG